MKKDWGKFKVYTMRTIKGSMMGLCLIPIFYLFLNTDIHRPNYFIGLAVSLRIGLEIVVVNLILCSVLYSLIYRWSVLKFTQLTSSLGSRLLVGLANMLIGLCLASLIEPYFGGREFGTQTITTGLLIGGITYLAFLLFLAYKETQSHNLKLRAESAETNLSVLKNQMQPHFLFNSLNSLAELIDSNHGAASEMAIKLSDLYREILEASKKSLSSLETELSVVQKYLELESLRFGSRLKFSIQNESDASSIFLPSLVLQTLVENAIKHGISQNLSGGSVNLTIATATPGYQVLVRNTCAPVKFGDTTDSKKVLPSTGSGLANTIARLDLLYGRQHNFRFQTENGETTAQFWISGENDV